MAKVSETGSSSVMIGVWWCPCNTCFPWVKVGVPMWKSNTSLVLRCSDAQRTKIAIFCSKRRSKRHCCKKWSFVMNNLILQIHNLTHTPPVECLVWVACLLSKILMSLRAEMKKGGLPLPLAFQYLILMIWRACDVNLVTGFKRPRLKSLRPSISLHKVAEKWASQL